MKKTIIIFSFLLIYNFAYCQKKITYPIAPKDTSSNIYFGEIISDPYQWMENPNDPRLLIWLEEQEAFTNKISHKQTRKRELRAQLVSIYNDVYRDKTRSFKKRDKNFIDEYEFDLEITNYNKSGNLMYKHRDQLSFKRLMTAKDYLTNDEDNISYTSQIVGEQNDLAVVTVSINGSDWETAYIFDLKNKKQHSFVLHHLHGSNIYWHKNTLYYDAYSKPKKGRELLDKAQGQKLYKYEIGKDSIPQLLYTNPSQSGTNPFSFIILKDKLFFLSLSHFKRPNLQSNILGRFKYIKLFPQKFSNIS